MSVFQHVREDAAEWWRRFWNQPNKAFRNFQLVFTFLTLHFFFPSLTYYFSPQTAIGQLKGMGNLIGAGAYPFAEDGYVWRILGAGNVLTIAFMCFLLQLNVRRFYLVLLPLCVLKASASFGFLGAYLFAYPYKPFLGVFIWDFTNVLMFLYFAHTAYWGLEEWGEETAVPRLFFKR